MTPKASPTASVAKTKRTKRRSPSSVARFRRALEEQRVALIARFAAIDGTAYASHRLAGDEHVLAVQLEAMRQVMVDTENALRRIDVGTYGTCERCAEAIPAARLEIRPHARFCVTCQQREDARAA
jgi:DnaK suppressor protein